MGTHGWQMQGRFMSEGYTAMDGTNLNFVNACLGEFDPTHPIMAGVTDICDYYRMTGTYLTADSTAVAMWNDGQIFVAAKDDRTVVSVNGYVGSAWQWTGQMDLMIRNAIFWLMGPTDVPWIWEVPVSGTLTAGSVEDIGIYFTSQYTDGTPMPLGTYTATLTISNNDPVAKSQTVPVIMHIVTEYVLPEASFTATKVKVGEPTVFTNTTVAGVPPVTTFEWNFGDGTPPVVVGTWDPISHVYATFGRFTVSLKACNDFGCTTFTKDVDVLPNVILLPLVNKN
jgi:PKD repeat protein